MAQVSNDIIGMIQERMDHRLGELETLTSYSLENVPDEVKQMREASAEKLRAVIMEQRDIMAILKMLYPNGKGKG